MRYKLFIAGGGAKSLNCLLKSHKWTCLHVYPVEETSFHNKMIQNDIRQLFIVLVFYLFIIFFSLCISMVIFTIVCGQNPVNHKFHMRVKDFPTQISQKVQCLLLIMQIKFCETAVNVNTSANHMQISILE